MRRVRRQFVLEFFEMHLQSISAENSNVANASMAAMKLALCKRTFNVKRG